MNARASIVAAWRARRPERHGASWVQSVTGGAVRYVTAVPRAQARGLVARVYEQMEREFELVPPLTALSPCPEVLAAAWILTRETLVVGRAGRGARESIAAGVSLANRCPYCVDVHASMLHADDRHTLAAAMASAKDGQSVDDPLVRWAMATRTPGAEQLQWPPFDRDQWPQMVATAVGFHFINRVVTVMLRESPGPVPLKSSVLKDLFARGMARVIGRRVVGVDARPGQSLELLPDHAPHAAFAWASGNPHVSDALAKFNGAIEAQARRAMPEEVMRIVGEAVGRWDGSDPELASAWLDDGQRMLQDPGHAPTLRLAMLTAMAPHRVNATLVDQARRQGCGDRELVSIVAWASLQAARRIASWLVPAGAVVRTGAAQ
jgi:AhpD family alkylhydroperoxidase